jgi:protein tyrosine/serine phosphatase
MKRKLWKYTGLNLCGVTLLIGGYLGGLQLTDNFHEVLPGVLYRSAQPSATDITNYVRKYGIRMVVNLRGENDSDWYRQEIAATEQANIEHLDFRMSASQELSVEQAAELVQLLSDAPKPLLIHCQSGADRTGLASVLYLQQIAGIDEKTAEGQLSIRYGHIGIPYISSAYAMDRTWEKLERIFGLSS